MSRPTYTAAQVADMLTATVVAGDLTRSPEQQIKKAVQSLASRFTRLELEAGMVEMEKRLGLR
ncbi:hypothetical protein [Streptomyces malaysiensis]|uniref:Uncharacterized protein n=1 Tax=Streptomyces malaysiensis subsp. samsunensis TaxID=459658 RepID=A0A9X2LXY8_STRMQ|nr:hypothetical protein [Streptomyces samsunensis]MCQ8831797.1 hypothetical protein [Streptomyces samsunensis]